MGIEERVPHSALCGSVGIMAEQPFSPLWPLIFPSVKWIPWSYRFLCALACRVLFGSYTLKRDLEHHGQVN